MRDPWKGFGILEGVPCGGFGNVTVDGAIVCRLANREAQLRSSNCPILMSGGTAQWPSQATIRAASRRGNPFTASSLPGQLAEL
jgi:hypothetical protein